MWAKQKQSGFTIVELLIVIVVIAILAATTIVAYNGIQTRAKNTATINATNAWMKALKLYQADNGSYPNISSCLGKTTTYPDNGWCWTSSAWVVFPSFLSAMQPYIGASYPEPDVTNIDSTYTRRGALFSAGPKLIYMSLSGISTCPDMSAPHYDPAGYPVSGGMYCLYQM